MPLPDLMEEARVILGPSDLEMLGRVLDDTATPGEDDREREARASRILAYFLAGISDEAQLCRLVKRDVLRN
ncbi:MAG: hypothetical protein E5X45_29410 [Mesorhizobium sp.]|nr:hypothetical protein EOD29_26265 [Mesorhizobium sp. M1A.T.Ca.IN.004.03.1.1]RWK28010.1 MAG: hypothetical protein EOR40_28985 [Mesorhizobium sp.]RWK85209.1 MAG: hypothetical protein EOR52_28255 [Mesorhizobium sp.]TIP15297.1 MAG: hypothetical protein E5X66_30655 [Mesorhizobium sp.]TJV76810.1 MAG: hypothetical protein E5X45_29410 [Mesorhizobium sp.]